MLNEVFLKKIKKSVCSACSENRYVTALKSCKSTQSIDANFPIFEAAGQSWALLGNFDLESHKIHVIK